MERQAVQSSNIRSIGYDATTRTLEIEFSSGGVYQYYSVDEAVYEQLISASSIGSFFHQHIRDKYQTQRIQ
ncbi:MAG: KTSC domain-containing protein [Nitrososphaera sp.]